MHLLGFRKNTKHFIPLRAYGPVVQLDRMTDSGSVGCGFESRRDHRVKN